MWEKPGFLGGPGLPDGFIFKPKIPIWVKFGGPWYGKRCNI
jgi:hypothetical protein